MPMDSLVQISGMQGVEVRVELLETCAISLRSRSSRKDI
jgi:hypothetical protein